MYANIECLLSENGPLYSPIKRPTCSGLSLRKKKKKKKKDRQVKIKVNNLLRQVAYKIVEEVKERLRKKEKQE